MRQPHDEEAWHQLRTVVLDMPAASGTQWQQGEGHAVALFDVYLGQRLEFFLVVVF